MSMFKTLQNNPGVITFFNSSSSSLSQSLLSHLQKSSKPYYTSTNANKGIWNKVLNGQGEKTPRSKYEIELIDNGFPTYDQLKIIKSFVNTHPNSKSTFFKVFPNFIDQQNDKARISDIKIPDEEQLQNLKPNELDALFHPPLIIDWDNQLIANDDESLQRILKHYKAENHSNGD